MNAIKKIRRGLHDALTGLEYAYKQDKSFRIEVNLSVIVLVIAYVAWPLASYEFLFLALAVALVFIAELVNTALHAYLFRSDLAGSFIHLHPARGMGGIWKNQITLPTAGTWHLVTQMAKDGIMYHLTTPLQIEGLLAEKSAPALTTSIELAHTVIRLQTKPQKVEAGVPVALTFEIETKSKEESGRIRESRCHNFIVARAEDGFSWNFHGDGSVIGITEKAPVIGEQIPEAKHFFTYRLAFPKPGLWMLYLEFRNTKAQFFVKVLNPPFGT